MNGIIIRFEGQSLPNHTNNYGVYLARVLNPPTLKSINDALGDMRGLLRLKEKGGDIGSAITSAVQNANSNRPDTYFWNSGV